MLNKLIITVLIILNMLHCTLHHKLLLHDDADADTDADADVDADAND